MAGNNLVTIDTYFRLTDLQTDMNMEVWTEIQTNRPTIFYCDKNLVKTFFSSIAISAYPAVYLVIFLISGQCWISEWIPDIRHK